MSDSASSSSKGSRTGLKDSRRRSKILTVKTYDLVKATPALKMWTVRAALHGVGLGAVGLLPGAALVALGAGGFATEADSGNTALLVAGIALMVVGVVAGWTAANIQIAALVAASDDLLHDRPSDPVACRATAREHVGTLLGWSMISVLVGVVVSFIRGDSGGGIASTIVRTVLAGVVAAAWSVITLLVMPVIVLENLGAIAAIKRSSSLIKSSWGTAILGGVRIGLRFFVRYTLPGIAAVAAGVWLGLVVGGATGFAVALVLVAAGLTLVLIGAVFATTCKTVFGVALYRWSTSGEVVGPFTLDDLAGAVRTRS
jgi:hypothetical protein